jgi:riboflavin synthase
MFTGIVAAVGEIVDVVELEPGNPQSGVRLAIQVPGFLRDTTRLGDSIAIQGACMTVVELAADQFSVDVSRESLNRTVGLGARGAVNLEHALRMGDSLDGHLVSGHVDGVGQVAHFAPVGESWELRIRVPRELARFMAYKGSVTVNGVSLTVNRVEDTDTGCEISINLIPHTVQVTTLKHLHAGAQVNLEIDLLARYVDRLSTAPR